MFFTNIGRHLRALADVAGREPREPFWLWVLAVYVVQMMVGVVVMMPFTQAMLAPMTAMAAKDPEYLNTHPEVMANAMMQIMPSMFRSVMIGAAVASLMLIVLLGAAMVRRLHDGDRSGWWASPLLLMQVATPLLFASVMPDVTRAMAAASPGQPGPSDPAFMQAMAVMMPLSILNLVGLGVMIATIVVLAKAGTKGPNRYGEDPLARR